jgi:hypothetical protein
MSPLKPAALVIREMVFLASAMALIAGLSREETSAMELRRLACIYLTFPKEFFMRRTFVIFGALCVAAILLFVVLGKTGTMDMAKKQTLVPAGAIPHGGKEKPVTEQTIGTGQAR